MNGWLICEYYLQLYFDSIFNHCGNCVLQLEKFAEKFMSANNKTDGAALDKYDIVSLGHFVCGLSVANITKIKMVVYG